MRDSDLYGSLMPFSIEELQLLKELKDIENAEVNRLAKLRAQHLAEGKSLDSLPVTEGGTLGSTALTNNTATSSTLVMDTNVNAAKKQEPKLKGRRG